MVEAEATPTRTPSRPNRDTDDPGGDLPPRLISRRADLPPPICPTPTAAAPISGPIPRSAADERQGCDTVAKILTRCTALPILSECGSRWGCSCIRFGSAVVYPRTDASSLRCGVTPHSNREQTRERTAFRLYAGAFSHLDRATASLMENEEDLSFGGWGILRLPRRRLLHKAAARAGAGCLPPPPAAPVRADGYRLGRFWCASLPRVGSHRNRLTLYH